MMAVVFAVLVVAGDPALTSGDESNREGELPRRAMFGAQLANARALEP